MMAGGKITSFAVLVDGMTSDSEGYTIEALRGRVSDED